MLECEQPAGHRSKSATPTHPPWQLIVAHTATFSVVLHAHPPRTDLSLVVFSVPSVRFELTLDGF